MVNASKIKYILAGGTEYDRIRPCSIVTIDGDTFEVVEEFVYLGSLLTANNNASREIRRRIICGSHAHYGLQKKLLRKYNEALRCLGIEKNTNFKTGLLVTTLKFPVIIV